MKCTSLILGNIVTLDSTALYAQAMACKDGRIIYVGMVHVDENGEPTGFMAI